MKKLLSAFLVLVVLLLSVLCILQTRMLPQQPGLRVRSCEVHGVAVDPGFSIDELRVP